MYLRIDCAFYQIAVGLEDMYTEFSCVSLAVTRWWAVGIVDKAAACTAEDDVVRVWRKWANH